MPSCLEGAGLCAGRKGPNAPLPLLVFHRQSPTPSQAFQASKHTEVTARQSTHRNHIQRLQYTSPQQEPATVNGAMVSEKHPMEVVNTSVALPGPGTNNGDGSGNGTRPRLDFYTWGMLYHLDTTMAELEPASSFLRAREQLREVAAQMDLDSVDSETDDTDILMFRCRRSRGRPRQTPPADADAAADAAAAASATAATPAPTSAPAEPAGVASVKVYRSSRQTSTTTATSESPAPAHTASLSRLEMAMTDREADWRRIQLGNSGFSISILAIALLVIMGLLLLVGAIVIAFWLLAK